jgi:hypothetical protein
VKRAHPFDLLFAGFREGEFEAIRAELGDRIELENFLLVPPAIELMKALRPERGFGEAVDDFVALVHGAYRFWNDGERTVSLDERQTRALCEPTAAAAERGHDGVRYFQVAPRLIWAQLDDAAAFEPLDGWFSVPVAGGLRVVACFGVHAERPGISVASAEGGSPGLVARSDGSPLFAPVMPGADAADLLAVIAPEELLLLGYRAAQSGKST